MIELLENRIAPAVVTFFEADGDKVTVTTSNGTTGQLEAALGITNGTTGVHGFTLTFDNDPVIASVFNGTNLTIKASGAGNHLADFVGIDAFDANDPKSIDLGKVNVKGNLVFIDAGNANLDSLAIKKLTVTNWVLGDGASAATVSDIQGDIGSIVVKGNFNGSMVSKDTAGNANFSDSAGTHIGSFKVNHTLGTGAGNNVGNIQVRGIDKLKVQDFVVGLIEASFIGKIAIGTMQNDARIIVSL